MKKIPTNNTGKITDKTSEQAFQIRLAKKRKAEREKKKILLWKKLSTQFLESESAGAQITKIALGLVIVAGISAVFSVMPGLTVLAGQYRRARYYSKKQLYDAGENLKRRGYVEVIQKSGVPRIRLTKKGEAYFEKMLFEEARMSSQEKWDGIWRFVIFDVPIEHSKARSALRRRLFALGFFQYQKSVWVYPYPCKEEVLFVADYFGIGRFVEILEATGLSNDKILKKHFKLV